MHELLTPCAKTSAESSPGSKELDAKTASYFCENGIASKLLLPQVSLFKTAASSSFTLMIEESMMFARQNPLQSYKVPHRPKFSGELLDNGYESTEKLVAPIFVVKPKYGATIACQRAQDVCLGWWRYVACVACVAAFRAEILGVGLGFRVYGSVRIWCLGFRV